jgi:hypothetical protein
MPVGSQGQRLKPNSAGVEDASDTTQPNATGFSVTAFGASQTHIYIAIRRPMKVPTTGTSVFAVTTNTTGAGTYTVSTGFPVDLGVGQPTNGSAPINMDRLRGGTTAVRISLKFAYTQAEINSTNGYGFDNNVALIDNYFGPSFGSGTPVVYWNFRRAPGFFDEVCYTGTGANQNITHNLTVVPELIICKTRSGSVANWVVWNTTLNSSTGYLYLNDTIQASNFAGVWNGAPTSTYFTLGTNYQNNESGFTFVAYLFATCPGVSKVGSYTGNGGTQAIACGFTGGARFVLIKRTDASGDWYVYDTARGMTVLTDPYILWNSDVAESATLGSVTTTTGGFTVDATVLAAINTNAASYIFLAIA